MKTQLRIQKFDLSTISPDSSILIVGRRRTGKSWIIRDLMYALKDKLPSGVVFSRTANVNKFFHSFIPELFIHDDVDLKILEKIMSRQTEKIETMSKHNVGTKFIILDDVLDDTKWVKDSTIKGLMFNGRHIKFFFILAIQYINSIPQSLMNNFDYVFLLNESSLKSKKKLCDSFGGAFECYSDFDNIFKQCVKDHGCMVINTSGTDISDSIYHFKSKERCNFKVGDPGFWKYSKKQCNKKNKELIVELV